MNIKRCSKFQGFGHIALVFPNPETITLADWEAVRKEEKKEGREEKGTEELKKEEIDHELQHESEPCNKELDFQKCLYSEQELRIILFQQTENDGYLLRQDHEC